MVYKTSKRMKKSYGEKKKDKNFIGIEYEFENRIDVPN